MTEFSLNYRVCRNFIHYHHLFHAVMNVLMMDSLKHCTVVHLTIQNIKTTLKQSLFSFLKQHFLYLSFSHTHTHTHPSAQSSHFCPSGHDLRDLYRNRHVCVCMSVISSARWQLQIFDLPHAGHLTHTPAIHGIWWTRTHTHSTNHRILEDNLISMLAVCRWYWATVANKAPSALCATHIFSLHRVNKLQYLDTRPC